MSDATAAEPQIPLAPPTSSRVTRPQPLRPLLERWFVQYNPLYLLSVCCTLIGVYLLSAQLDQHPVPLGDIWLALGVEAYQGLLVAGAALLARLPGQRRPAVMLALIAVPLVFDVTLQTEQLATYGAAGTAALAVWPALLLTKTGLLTHILGIRQPRSVWAILAVAATVPRAASRTSGWRSWLACCWAASIRKPSSPRPGPLGCSSGCGPCGPALRASTWRPCSWSIWSCAAGAGTAVCSRKHRSGWGW